ncbi:MAG: histidinol phosphate phosphatase domain-containing protein [Thermoplasmata archaeon]|nr:histidinol phosphate phosphatase domain-containing protein [Thermoplasmata archaeon]
MPGVRFDFHSHSFLSDGMTSATDMWHEARFLGHRALALTDHLSLDDPEPLMRRLHREAAAWKGERFVPLVGVELTKLPPRKIASTARAARKAGAEIVLVHGETVAEHVPKGTNRAALESRMVDILAHPGLLTPEEAQLAKDNDVVLEISARRGHSLANGHVARIARSVGAELVVDSDAHAPDQLVPAPQARRIALGAGIPEDRIDRVLEASPKALLRRCRLS